MAKPLPWTSKDDRFLREHHGVLSGKEIAEQLGRTPKACGVRATKLGIRSLRSGWTAAKVGLEVGVDTSTVTRWIAQKLLEANRKPTYEASQSQHWRIEEESIVRFLQTHYLKYDPSRLKEPWKVYVPWQERAKWISIEKASGEYDRSIQWFYELVWSGEIRATKGWNRLGETTYLYRQDIESVKARVGGTNGTRPFARRADAMPLEGYKKQKRRQSKRKAIDPSSGSFNYVFIVPPPYGSAKKECEVRDHVWKEGPSQPNFVVVNCVTCGAGGSIEGPDAQQRWVRLQKAIGEKGKVA